MNTESLNTNMILRNYTSSLEVRMHDEDGELPIIIRNKKSTSSYSLTRDEAKELVWFINAHLKAEKESNPSQ